jgi:hypothetical protein
MLEMKVKEIQNQMANLACLIMTCAIRGVDNGPELIILSL